ncbi:MAG: DUF6460 domain-containing protein [Alphaproteobacteria bacterium]|nr:DUF6460 domain-containing protein [Alphaproteobacteria bacterium]
MDERPGIMTTEPEKPEHRERDFGAIRGTVIKLVLASLLVGFVMYWFGWTPIGILRSLTENFEELFTDFASFITWVVEFILLGATIVVPIWLLMRLMGRKRGS